MKNSGFVLGFVFILSSCSSGGDLFTENQVKIKSFKQEKRLTGTLLLEEAFGFGRMAFVDEYLVLITSRRENYFFV
jgi:hypothetical protein